MKSPSSFTCFTCYWD